LFDALAAWIGDRTVVDLCAGTGSLGIEALSRGAACAVFVDNDPSAVRAIKTNLAQCALPGQDAVWRTDAVAALRYLGQSRCTVDLIIADPPYDAPVTDDILQAVATLPVLAGDGFLIIEHSVRTNPALPETGLEQVRRRTYGDTALSFYQQDEQARITSPRSDTVIQPVDLPPPSPRKRR
jgi:16S rRNA (guanine(966)-N(2))-methyltransferase RsmD